MLLTFDKIIEKNKNIKIIFKNKITDITKNKILNHIKNKNNILFEPFSETSYQHLKEYNKVVLQLDTYPYNGTTTTCESLLMGVPVLSLYNDSRFCSSMGANIINGVSDKFSKIVKSYTEYVNYAVSFANAPVDEIKESVRKSFLTYCENSEFKKEFETFLENKFKEINL
jgi:predicted O-linked N-acetylglucosamine transferase (SPINDLY family)